MKRGPKLHDLWNRVEVEGAVRGISPMKRGLKLGQQVLQDRLLHG